MNVFGVLGFLGRRARFSLILTGLTVKILEPNALASDVTLAWDPANDPTVAGYNVYIGGASRNYTNLVDAGDATSVTISNLAPGATYYFAATTYTVSGLESDYSSEAVYTVPQTILNYQPTLDPIGNAMVNENSGPQTIDLTGISSGSPTENQTLTVTAFSSDTKIVPNPTITYTSPNPNALLTFTPAPNAAGVANMTVMVDDGGTVSNTIIRTFTITVNILNNQPTLDALSNVTIAENSGRQTVNLSGISSGATNEIQTLTVTAASSNPSLIPNPTVSYTSANTAGTLAFAPVTNAFGSAQITVTVDDGQPLNNTITRSFTVTVNQTTTAPATITNAVIIPNTAFRMPLVSPHNNSDKISYSLGAGAPAGVKVATHHGTSYLAWSPTTAQALTTNLITVVLTDGTNPNLSTNELVLLTVLDYLGLTMGSTSVQAGQNATIPIYLSSSSGVTNLSFTVDWASARFSNPSLFISVSGVAGSSVQAQGTNLLFSLQTAAGQVLQKSNLIAHLNFQTVAGQSSAFVNMTVRNLSATKPDSTPYMNYMPTAGQVAVVSTKPLLAAYYDLNANRVLTAFGNVGATYQIQSSSTPALASSWVPLSTYTQTNISQNLPVDTSNPFIFYRLLVP
jgi:hypothetical protein